MFGEIFISAYTLIALNIPSIFPMYNSTMLPPDISAKSAIVADLKTGNVLYEKNAQEILPYASLTKLISALVVLDSIPLEKEITMSEEVLQTEGEVGNFRKGERVKARHLLFSSLIQSSNDAMMALASDLGIDNFLTLTKSKLIQLGVKKVKVTDPTGLDPQTVGSATDLVKIAKGAFFNDFIRKILSIPEYTFTSSSGISHKAVSTNNLLFDPHMVIAKTGSLDAVGQNYAALIRPAKQERDLIMVIIGSQNRNDDAVKLFSWLDKAFLWE